MDIVKAHKVEHGDIVGGSDGKSTVVRIRNHNGHLIFDFAEGKGNRCLVVHSEDDILRHKKTKFSTPSGFAVDQSGKVISRYITNVQQEGNILVFYTAHGATHRIRNDRIRHIVGNFIMFFKSE